MAFIDKIGEKLTSGVNAVQDSTKKVTESARINNEISNNKKEIDRLLTQIGICVKARLVDKIDDEDVKQLAAKIDQLNERNDQLASQLKAVKGITRCTNCNYELPAGTMFCPECGTRNLPPVNQPTNQQPAQQMNNAAAASSAPKKKVVNVRAASANNPAPAPVNEPEPAQTAAPDKQICPNCGYHEDPDGMFCSNCGTKLR
ncbi:MAG: zinc-ribbon domain-containing protein [Oscillospiraceae bacterium]